MKIVIVGGVAAGMSAATRLRRGSEDAQIVVLEAGDHVSYANCGLPYHAGGVIEDREALLLQTPESLAARFRLDVRVGHRVVDVDPDARTVTVETADGTVVESYDELVLSPGARPVVPPVPGVERALVLRDVADVDRLVREIDRATADDAGDAPADGPTAVVIGAGFVGLEVAENLVRRGLRVTLVELADQVLAPLDPEMAVRVHDELVAHGVDVRTSTQVAEVLPASVRLADPESRDLGTVPADVVVAAIGVRPDTTLAERAGAALGPRGGVLVDDDLRTSVAHVWAVGDVATKRDALAPGTIPAADDAAGLASSATLIPLANLANRHGRHVADVILGRRTGHRPAIGTAVVGVFGLTAATTGRSEKRLRAEGRAHRVIHTHPAQHAGYYPGATPMALKLLVDPATDAILGAQAVGRDGVDKRIDVIATAVAGGLTASDLMDLELAYAPAYGSAKDPVNMLGYVADNLRAGETRSVQWHELDAAVAAGAVVVDVRTPDEHARGTVEVGGVPSLALPLDELRARHHEIAGRRVVVHCQVGQRGHTAARLLTGLGHDVVNLDGGNLTWRDGVRAQAVRSVTTVA
ncbi:NADPH-dependent 2,4-dienoyl-CoA reductase/sulfur reductase-like enzyme [Sediminihabitans luteus]|uniref:NADPH-dependent 2,4-dienoyl-CoA reductase/sulfur reductase-like enzyme n=1 Tax=Sediminihabitans luteus TaxID=1138585 RepID=A0A2M9D195_9CELL|nr:FAD-dependent oxidoreductase [Sediminihabitans luteus]PJJ77981.1 NADPH-dependent 2,4-dienoyl-CoA reductase/sulfur reductase-like enzyme [Sediminihabitans luteus]GIJ00612.1 CoA-disulfide reductase [Sediminihabitans luteus]